MSYKAIIGLEFHCEMKSNTKVFSPSKNSFSKVANQNVAPLDMAFPGTLPMLNKTCVRKALMMSMILNCKQPEFMEFDRKNYYYPDLPKGYQITQETKDKKKRVNEELQFSDAHAKALLKIAYLYIADIAIKKP